MSESNCTVVESKSVVTLPETQQVPESGTNEQKTPPAATKFPFAGKLPVRGILIDRTESGTAALVKVGEQDEDCVFAHVNRRVSVTMKDNHIVWAPRKNGANNSMPENGVEVVVLKVSHPMDRLFSHADAWCLASEFDAEEAKIIKIRPYVCDRDNPRKNIAEIVKVKGDKSLGTATAATGEALFVHPGNRLAVRRQGLELVTFKSTETEVPLGAKVYFSELISPRVVDGNRVMIGWVPCTEVDAVDAEIKAEKAKIVAKRVEAEARERKIKDEENGLEWKALAKIADRKAREEAEKKARIEDLLARQLETGYQVAGSFDRVVCDTNNPENNEAEIVSVPSNEFAIAKTKGERGELLRVCKMDRAGVFLKDSTTVSFCAAAAADAKPVAVGDVIIFNDLNEVEGEGQPRETVYWVLREEFQSKKPAAEKSAKTQAELAAEVAEAESKRKQDILSSASAKKPKQGGGEGKGKKGKNKN